MYRITRDDRTSAILSRVLRRRPHGPRPGSRFAYRVRHICPFYNALLDVNRRYSLASRLFSRVVSLTTGPPAAAWPVLCAHSYLYYVPRRTVFIYFHIYECVILPDRGGGRSFRIISFRQTCVSWFFPQLVLDIFFFSLIFSCFSFVFSTVRSAQK